MDSAGTSPLQFNDSTSTSVEEPNNEAKSGTSGGGLYAEAGSAVVLETCAIRSNVADGSGGGIFTEELVTLDISGSTIARNTSFDDAGGILIGGGSLFHLTNSTISTNTASDEGGAMLANNATVQFKHATIANNRATRTSGGIAVAGLVDSGWLKLSHTILAANGLGGLESNIDAKGAGDVTSLGYNLVGVSGIPRMSTDIFTTDPWLAPLSRYGGPLETHALLAQSAAIDGGNPNLDPALAPALDQRGFARFQSTVDIGAVEAGAVLEVTTELDGGTGSLREALETAVSGQRILFADALSDAIIHLGGAHGGEGDDLTMDQTLMIDATGLSEGIKITGDDETRILDVKADVSASLHGVSLGSGYAINSGGAIKSKGRLTMTYGSIRHSYSASKGGAIAALDGRLYLQNVTISGNESDDTGGAIRFGASATGRIEHCTIHNNSALDDGVGGIDVFQSDVSLYASIVSVNRNDFGEANFGVAPSFDLKDRLHSRGYNLSNGDLPVGVIYIGDIDETLPELEGLKNNGGWGSTHLLEDASPAKEAGDPNPFRLPRYDQRGPGYDRVEGGVMDMGAVEVEDLLPAPKGDFLLGQGSDVPAMGTLAVLQQRVGNEPTTDDEAASMLGIDNRRGGFGEIAAFEQWTVEHFGETARLSLDPNLDDDGDGISRLFEFVHGLNPKGGESIPTTWIEIGANDRGDGRSIEFFYRVSKRALHSLNITIEESRDGLHWTRLHRQAEPELIADESSTVLLCVRRDLPRGESISLSRLSVEPKRAADEDGLEMAPRSVEE